VQNILGNLADQKQIENRHVTIEEENTTDEVIVD